MLALILALTNEESHEILTYLYNRYSQEMLKVARSQLSKWDNIYLEPEDMLQEAFLRLSKHVDIIDIHGDEPKLRVFLKTVIENVTWTLIRREYPKRNTVSMEELESEPTIEDNVLEQIQVKEDYNRVLGILRGMKPIYRDTLTLHYVHQLNAETIASLTDAPVKTVYTRLSRGLEILKKRYFEEEQKTEETSEEEEKSKNGKQ